MKISRRKFLLGMGAGIAIAGGVTVAPMINREGEFITTTSRGRAVLGTQGDIPSHTDVAIIGAGIIGIMTAINLREQGVDVTIFEKGEIAGEQSTRAYGQIISYQVFKEIFPLHHYGKELWRKMNARIGADTSYRTTGRIAIPSGGEEIEKTRTWLKEAQEWAAETGIAFNTRFIEGQELKDRLIGAQSTFPIAGFEEDAGALDPEVATPALAEYAKRIGVKIYNNCAVRGIETEGGRVSDVVTEKGAVRTRRVVLAAGYWSRLFMGNLGIKLPLLPVYLAQSRMQGLEGMPRVNVHMPYGEIGIHFRPQADGSYAVAPRVFTESITRESFQLASEFLPLLFSGAELPLYFKLGKDLFSSFTIPQSWRLDEVSPFEQYRTVAATPNNAAIDLHVELTRQMFPIFRDSEVIERWGAVVPITNDEIPIVSEVPTIPGLVINVPVGWGMTEGPVSGQITADLVMGKTPILSPAAFSINRFSQ